MCHRDSPAPIRGGCGCPGAIAADWVELAGADRPFPAFLARPAAVEVAPAVLIGQDSWGANLFSQDLAGRLAGEGFAGLLPDLFVCEGPLPARTREAGLARRGRPDQADALADRATAPTWLRDHPATDVTRGTIGRGLGSTCGLRLAARDPGPAATVAYDGFPVVAPTRRARFVPPAKAQDVRSPLLAFRGDQDHGVGMDSVAAFDAAVTAAGACRECVIDPGRPHGCLTFDPVSLTFEAATGSWDRTLDVLGADLGQDA